MSKATIIMIGLAIMALSVFGIVFGLYGDAIGLYSPIASILAVLSTFALLAGFIMYSVIRKE